MPSSLAWGLPPTSVCSTRPPASVCGTGAGMLASGFSRRSGLGPFGAGRSPCLTLAPRSTPARICLCGLPTGLEGHVVTPGPTPPRPRVTQAHAGGAGIWTGCPSPAALALGLGPPHPQRISLAAEPSGIRWEGFAPSSRYSCRHSHSQPLQVGSRLPFAADWDAPLPRALRRIRGFGARLEPRWIVGAAARSTSELLRTLSRVAASKPTSWLSPRRDCLAHLVWTWGP